MFGSDARTLPGVAGPQPAGRRWRGWQTRFALPVLVGAACVFGASVASVAFVGVWQQADSHRRSADSALRTTRQQVTLLQADKSQLDSQTVALKRSLSQVRLELAAASRELALARSRESANAQRAAQLGVKNDALLGQTRRLQQVAARLGRNANALSGLAARLANDLASLENSLGQGGGPLDPAFLRTQLAYLKPLAAQIQTAAAELSAASQAPSH